MTSSTGRCRHLQAMYTNHYATLICIHISLSDHQSLMVREGNICIFLTFVCVRERERENAGVLVICNKNTRYTKIITTTRTRRTRPSIPSSRPFHAVCNASAGGGTRGAIDRPRGPSKTLQVYRTGAFVSCALAESVRRAVTSTRKGFKRELAQSVGLNDQNDKGEVNRA